MSPRPVVFLFLLLVVSTISAATDSNLNLNTSTTYSSSGRGRQQISNAVQILGLAKKLLRWFGESERSTIDVEWIIQKLNLLQLYVSAGSAFAERLDADLVDTLIFGNGDMSSGDGRRSINEYPSTWRYKPPIPSFVRKGNTKLKPDEDDEDLLGSYGHSHSSYGGGGGGYDDGYSGGI